MAYLLPATTLGTLMATCPSRMLKPLARERVVCVLDTVLGEHHHTLVVRDMRRGVIDVPRDIVMLADDPDGASVRISDRGYIDVPGLEGYRCTEYECQEGE